MRVLRIVLCCVVCVCVLSTPASAQKDKLTVGIHYWTEVYDGMAQSYNVRLVGSEHGAYVVLSLHPDTEVLNVNHTDGLECTSFSGDGTTVMCYVDHLQGAEVVGVHGSIRGPGDNGIYGILRVGTLEEGSPGRGWILNANYRPRGGTIPSAIAPRPEPKRLTIYVPEVRK